MKKPQSADHGWRVAFSVVLFCTGTADIVTQRFLLGGGWSWEGSVMALVAVGVLFTNTFTTLVDGIVRILPFTRRG